MKKVNFAFAIAFLYPFLMYGMDDKIVVSYLKTIRSPFGAYQKQLNSNPNSYIPLSFTAAFLEDSENKLKEAKGYISGMSKESIEKNLSKGIRFGVPGCSFDQLITDISQLTKTTTQYIELLENYEKADKDGRKEFIENAATECKKWEAEEAANLVANKILKKSTNNEDIKSELYKCAASLQTLKDKSDCITKSDNIYYLNIKKQLSENINFQYFDLRIEHWDEKRGEALDKMVGNHGLLEKKAKEMKSSFAKIFTLGLGASALLWYYYRNNNALFSGWSSLPIGFSYVGCLGYLARWGYMQKGSCDSIKNKHRDLMKDYNESNNKINEFLKGHEEIRKNKQWLTPEAKEKLSQGNFFTDSNADQNEAWRVVEVFAMDEVERSHCINALKVIQTDLTTLAALLEKKKSNS